MQDRVIVRPRVFVRLCSVPAWGCGSLAIHTPAPQPHGLSASPRTTIQNF